MKELNTYISEKLKINKETKLYNPNTVFKSFKECFEYIKFASGKYGYAIKEKSHYLYVYKKNVDTYPFVLFAYSDETSQHELNTVEPSGRLRKGKIIYNVGKDDYSYNDYTNAFKTRDNGWPVPSVKYIDHILKQLNELA